MAKFPTTRYLETPISEDLQQKKMVFLGGPRQVGKTTLALKWLKNEKKNPGYFNFDIISGRKAWLNGEVPSDINTWVIDEIHKYKKWKTFIKGLYDQWGDEKQIIVTGSTRLDLYRKGGDSLQGRYHYFRVHPFSLPEWDASLSRKATLQLLEFGGFPEPLIKANARYWRRWQRERSTRLIKEDIRDVQAVRDLVTLENLLESLPERVANPLSIESLRQDLNVAHETVSHALDTLENFYAIFRLSPFGAPKIRAIKKERKLYLLDWSLVPNEGSRFENFVASLLLKYAHFREDYEGYSTELRYLKDLTGKEIDFIYLENKKPLFAAEAKLSDETFHPNLFYFGERVKIPIWYQIHLKTKVTEKKENGVWYRLLPFEKFCKEIGAV